MLIELSNRLVSIVVSICVKDQEPETVLSNILFKIFSKAIVILEGDANVLSHSINPSLFDRAFRQNYSADKISHEQTNPKPKETNISFCAWTERRRQWTTRSRK